MIWKRTLLLSIPLLLVLAFLGAIELNTLQVSALEYPAIYISPAAIYADPESSIGMNYTLSVYTDYSGSDVWGYEFNLFFDLNVLECVEVVNGDLITEDTGITMWSAGTLNNTSGEVETTGNGFWATPPAEPPVTSGPGTLANVTFTVVGYGISNITLGEDTRLIGYASGEKYDIINSSMMGHMEDGSFSNLLPGDIGGDTGGTPPDGDVDRYDFGYFADAYGSSLGDPNYNSLADLQGDTAGSPPDGDVDRYDFGAFADNYGRSI